jgi:hypothetical protein
LDKLRQIVEQAVSTRVGQHLAQLQQEIVEQVTREIEPLLEQAETKPGESPAEATQRLNAAMASIQEANAQADILKALLEAIAHFTARAALFVVRGTTLAGWQSRGFADENVRGVNVDGARGLAARAINDRIRVSAASAEFDADFNQRQGNPWDGSATLFPLVVRDKVAAVIYCDAGVASGTHSDYAAIEVLTRYSSLWLEHVAAKKPSAGSDAAAAVTAAVAAEPAETTSEERAEATAVGANAAPQSALDGLPAEEQELHRKAKRFAKLLVDEIKLYNQAKVAEGRQNREIYKLLREDIEKSRATYEKRYSGTPVASAAYFNEEVVRILADNDRALLGSDFPG